MEATTTTPAPSRRTVAWGLLLCLVVLSSWKLTTLPSTENTLLPVVVHNNNKTTRAAAAALRNKKSSDNRKALQAEQTQFMYPGNFGNTTHWQASKPTPSGWWPDAHWVEHCATHASQQFPIVPFHTLPEFTKYRLGDCLQLCQCGNKYLNRASVHTRNRTLAHQYFYDPHGCNGIRPVDNPTNNFAKNHTRLGELVDAKQGVPGFVEPDNDTLLVHLRLGDKLENKPSTVVELMQKGDSWGKKHSIIKSLYEILTSIVESNTSKVAIRGGSHFPEYYNKSKVYAYCLKEAVAQAGYNVTINIDEGNPDYDFYYVSHAKKIIITAGGFSHFIGLSVLHRGGTLFGRVFMDGIIDLKQLAATTAPNI